ncbi:uncharacterized protein LOC141530379 [Cotesia typhae]|uniref:uncharacterized protein LOC141530379 n=1 Tax=Cotesia typhae TaxID=2053667 RepID=UPI003D69A658
MENIKEEILYLIEVGVHDLELTKEKIHEATNKDFLVKIKFLSLPVLVMSLNDFESILTPSEKEKTDDEQGQVQEQKKQRETEDGNTVFIYESGKSCVFGKRPRDLLREMQTTPLRIGVFCNCDMYPIAETTVLFTGCICDQFAMSMNDSKHMPEPYALNGCWDLKDPGGNPAGKIKVDFKITCKGKFIVTNYQLKGKYSSPVLIPSVPQPDREEGQTVDPETPENQEIKSLFKVPEAPKIGINDPEFENLTEAEKLNDSQYRRLIYQLYPNERTCGCCSPTNAERYGGWCNSSNNNGNIDSRNHKSSEIRSDFPVRCGGCASSCCSSAWTTRWRQRQQQQGQQRFETPSTVEERKKKKGLNNGNDDKVLHFMSRYCVENQPSNELYNGTYCSDERIRGGGGSTREEDPGKPARGVEELKNSEWPGLALNECPKNSTYPMRYDDIAASNQIQTYYLSSRFKSTCPGSSDERNILNSRKSTKHSDTCRRKKCPHIDCLTRAFEEAQEFVDSLGKVPGLPGLGLMDPSASPYYRAPRDFKRVKDELQDEGNPYTSASTLPWTKATPFTIAVSGRNGIVREATVSDNDNYNYKYNYSRYNYGEKDKCNDELNTVDVIGPCGERQCKARRKKVHRETVVTEGIETPVEYADEPKKKSYLMRARHQDRDRDKDRKYKFNRHKAYHAGPRGDGFRKSIKKPKKRKIRKRVNLDFVSRSHSERLYGHKNCNDRLRRVPAHMGWFWTEYQPTGRLKPRVGWRPGAISKQIREMIQAAKIGLIEKRNRPASVPSAMRIGKKLKTKSSTMLKKKQPRKFDFNADFKAPPTLYIQRRDGIYYCTMYPVKQESENTPVLDEPMKPLQLKIAPNRDDASGASSSVASDMDIEFSPPAALNRAKKKPDVVHVDTQVRQQDILDAFQPLVPEVKKVKSRKSKKKKKK